MKKSLSESRNKTATPMHSCKQGSKKKSECERCLVAVFSESLSSPKLDVVINLGNPFLNLTVDGFLKIGVVAATRLSAEDTFPIIRKGGISSNDFEKSLKKMCKEGAYRGAIAGVYVGMEYGVERIRRTRNWKV